MPNRLKNEVVATALCACAAAGIQAPQQHRAGAGSCSTTSPAFGPPARPWRGGRASSLRATPGKPCGPSAARRLGSFRLPIRAPGWPPFAAPGAAPASVASRPAIRRVAQETPRPAARPLDARPLRHRTARRLSCWCCCFPARCGVAQQAGQQLAGEVTGLVRFGIRARGSTLLDLESERVGFEIQPLRQQLAGDGVGQAPVRRRLESQEATILAPGCGAKGGEIPHFWRRSPGRLASHQPAA